MRATEIECGKLSAYRVTSARNSCRGWGSPRNQLTRRRNRKLIPQRFLVHEEHLHSERQVTAAVMNALSGAQKMLRAPFLRLFSGARAGNLNPKSALLMRSLGWIGWSLALAVTTTRSMSATPQQATCQKIEMIGEVSAGQEWHSAFGEGWVFRVLPIDQSKTPPGQANYSGWDLVVDREQPAGFPDSLLLASPPYNSINEREVGTTFGVRAQDAIGWNPRSFRFLTDLAAFRESQQLYHHMSLTGPASRASNGPGYPDNMGTTVTPGTERFTRMLSRSSAGQFRILEARLSPGVSDAASFAESWAVASARTPHSFDPAPGNQSTPLGTLNWIRFSVTMWLPSTWRAPTQIRSTRAACSE